MKVYKNLDGTSGVTAYGIGVDFIAVTFESGVTYTYTNRSAGAANISRMKVLAETGRGLNTFINKYVRDKYQSRNRN